MRRVERRGPVADPRLADDLARPELLARQVDLETRREPVPHVRLDALAVEEHVGGKHVAAEQVVHDERRDVALAATRVVGRPVVLLVGGVEAPGTADRLLELRQRERQRLATPDQLDAIAVWVADEAEEAAAFAHLVRRALRLDALLAEARERRVEIVDADRDVAVTGSQLVRAAVVVVRQLEHRLGVSEREEVVRRLLLSVPDDVHVAVEGEAERLVERATALGIGDAHHRVQKVAVMNGRIVVRPRAAAP